MSKENPASKQKMSTAAAPGPAANPLEALVTETRHAFILAKADGKLEAGEVVQIAVGVAQKLHRLKGLSGEEKKALVQLTLKRGLEAAGGVESLPGLGGASPEVRAAIEAQLLAAAAGAVEAALAVAAGRVDLRKAATWQALCGAFCSAAAAVATVAAKDQPLVAEALALVRPQIAAPTAPEKCAEAAPPELAAPAQEDRTPAKQDETAPSPAAAAPAAPAPSGEVTFE